MRTPSSVMFDSAAHAASRSSLPCSTNSVVSTRTWTASCRAGSAAAVSYPNSASSTRRLRLRMSEPQAHADVVGAAWLGEGEVGGVAEVLVGEVFDAAAKADVVGDALAQLQVPEAVGGYAVGRVAGVGQLAADVLATQLGAEGGAWRPLQPGVGQVAGAVAQTPV